MVLNFGFFFFIGTKQVNQLSHSSLLNCSRWLCATHFRNILGHFCTLCISHHRDQELTLRFFKTNVIYIHDVSLQSNADSWSSTSTFLGFCSVLIGMGFRQVLLNFLSRKWLIFYFIAAPFVNVYHKTCSISCPSPIHLPILSVRLTLSALILHRQSTLLSQFFPT